MRIRKRIVNTIAKTIINEIEECNYASEPYFTESYDLTYEEICAIRKIVKDSGYRTYIDYPGGGVEPTYFYVKHDVDYQMAYDIFYW